MHVQQILRSKSDDGGGDGHSGHQRGTGGRSAVFAPDRRPDRVTRWQRVSGILSERDIVREIGRRGAACLSDTVDSLMTSAIISCRRDEQANDVLQKMTDGRFRHMPVMEGDQMVGLISIGDVVKARLTELAMEKDALEGMIKGF